MDEREESKRRHSELLAVPLYKLLGAVARTGWAMGNKLAECVVLIGQHFTSLSGQMEFRRRIADHQVLPRFSGEHELPGRVDCYPDY